MATIVRPLWLAAEWPLLSCNEWALRNFSRLFWVASKSNECMGENNKKDGQIDLLMRIWDSVCCGRTQANEYMCPRISDIIRCFVSTKYIASSFPLAGVCKRFLPGRWLKTKQRHALLEARLRWIRWGAVRSCGIEVCLWWIRNRMRFGVIGIRCLQMCSQRFCFSSFQAMTCTKETRSTLSHKPSCLVCSRHFATGKKWTSTKAPGICRTSPNVLMGNKDLHKMNIYYHKMTGFVKWPLTIKGWDF